MTRGRKPAPMAADDVRGGADLDDAKTEGRTDAIDMGLLPQLIGFNLRCAQVAVFQDFSRSAGTAEISPPQFGALIMIEANPGISQSAIASALRFDRSTLVQIIDRLQDRGFVVREVSASDRRSHALKLTEAGARALADLKAVVTEHEERMTRALSPDEKALLLSLLTRIHQAPSSD